MRVTRVGDRRSPGIKSAFILALVPSVIYLITRLWGITDFPAFFFSDEANNVLFGEQVIQNGFVGQDGSWLPVYFEWDYQRWAPVLPVYLHGLTSSLFGKSILVARATTSLLSFLGAVAVSILLKEIFRIRAWWAAIFFLAIMPAWFLYSRTAFETVVATAFFAWFLLCYLLYRYRSTKWIYASVAFGAAAFYSYSNQQLPLLFLSAALFASDFKYHQMHKDELLRATFLAFLLALPFIQFQALHPSGHADHLRAIHSYWVEPNPFGEKLQAFAANYLRGISPRYWFFVINDETNQLPNQHLPNSGNLGWYLIPFVLVGLTICFVRFRDPAHRTIIFSALVIPIGAAIDSIEIPRVLAFVVPAAVMASLGLEQIYVYRGRIPEKLITIALQLAFSFAAGAMLVTALMNGPDWVTRYSPGSKEFAVKPVFEERLPELLEAEEDANFILSTTWANKVEIFPRFFLDEDQQKRVILGNIGDYLYRKIEIPGNTIFVATVEEFLKARGSGLFSTIEVLDLVEYPDGKPAIYFARFEYAPDAERIFEELEAERRRLVEETVTLKGGEYAVRHSRFAAGLLTDALDGSLDTLVRGEEANPLQFEISFSEQQVIHEIEISLGSMADFTVVMRAGALDSQVEPFFRKRYRNAEPDPIIRVQLQGEGVVTSTLSIEILERDGASEAQIHVREIRWLATALSE